MGMKNELTQFGQKLKELGIRQSALARQLEVSPGLVSQWARGYTGISAKNALAIDRATVGLIPKDFLRPDLFGG